MTKAIGPLAVWTFSPLGDSALIVLSCLKVKSEDTPCMQ